jgi:DNA polymerase/3'-5' exonuclease PolX
VPSNIEVAELLARQAERESGILSRAFRRAARSAFLWPEEVAEVVAQNRSLTELRAVGRFIERQIRRWIDKPPRLTHAIPAIRQDFISLAEARHLLARKQTWARNLRGDLQMHTRWSDGIGHDCRNGRHCEREVV